MHRLRAQLGDPVVPTRPYLLAGDVDADFLAVPRLLQAGRLRDAVLHRRDAGALWTFAQTATGAGDLDVLETLSKLPPPTDTRRSVVLAWLRRVVG
ncbi:MAG: hypothetical protein M3Y48_03815 [Actinomycetota bacterium]|nr:hypothetical protein [Actinomycetota bacterium]